MNKKLKTSLLIASLILVGTIGIVITLVVLIKVRDKYTINLSLENEEFIKSSSIIKSEIGEVKQIKEVNTTKETNTNFEIKTTSSYIITNTSGNIYNVSIYRDSTKRKGVYYIKINENIYYIENGE